MNKVIHGDCLDVMRTLPDKSIDMILCDLPYGTTACKWDTIIPFELLWKEYKRLIKDNGAIVLTASQPFTSALVMSNLDMFKYCWVWNKRKGGNPLTAKQQPIKITEDVVIFGGGIEYYPLMTKRDKPKWRGGNTGKVSETTNNCFAENKVYYELYSKNIIDISNANQIGKLHPTQKPVALFEYLIKTYTNEGDTVLDNCAGSGTTGIACLSTNRNYILIEKEKEYIDIINKRIAEHEQQLTIGVM